MIGDYGFLAPIRDSTALAEQIVKGLALGDAGRRALGLRARDRIISEFSVDALTDRTSAELQKLVRG